MGDENILLMGADHFICITLLLTINPVILFTKHNHCIDKISFFLVIHIYISP